MDKILNRFLEFEKEKQLFTRQYNGIYYWQQIRFDITRVVLKTVGENKEIKLKKKQLLGIFLELLKGCIYDIMNFFHLKECDILYFDQQSYRYVDGKEVDLQFDFFELENEYSVQRCFYRCEGKADAYVNRGIGTFFPEIGRVCGLMLLKIFPILFEDRQEDGFIKELVDAISNEFQVEIKANTFKNRIRNTTYSYKVYYNYYKRIIRKISPKAIVVVCHYDGRLFPLYTVAQKFGIPVVELEHSLISNYDAYNYKDLTNHGKMLPDYLLTYGELWHKYIQLPTCMKAVAIGNPYLEDRVEKSKYIEPDEKKIVFYADTAAAFEEAQFATEFYQRCKKYGYKVYFKFHPMERSERKKKCAKLLENSGIKIVDENEDLYKLLANAKHHVSVASTVLFEAVAFKVKRYIMIKEGWTQYTQPLIDNGLAKGFKTIDEFKNLLNESTTDERNVSELMWKKNAKKNALVFFDELVSKGIK